MKNTTAKRSRAKGYSASLKVLGKTYTSKGKTVSEAIGNLKPGIARGTAILTLAKGDKSSMKILPVTRSTRLFNTYGMTREIQIKQAALMFEGL